MLPSWRQSMRIRGASFTVSFRHMSPLKYLLSVALTGFLAAFLHLTLFFYQLGAPIKAEYWLYESAIVKRMIADSIKEPKLVVLGGSNALFGINSTMLENALGIPTVNLALHASLSIDYLLQESRKVLQPHDHILLSLEYVLYARKSPYSLWFTNQIMTWDTAYFWDLSIEDKGSFVRSVPLNRLIAGALAQLQRKRSANFLSRTLANAEDVHLRHARALTDTSTSAWEVYSVVNIDAHGDVRHHPQRQSLEDEGYFISYPFVLSARVWEELREFSEYCQTRDITLYIVWPPTMKNPKLDFNSLVVQNHLQQLQSHMLQLHMQTLGLPWEFFYERALFSDTAYHLTPAGRSKHTEALLRYLRPLLLAPSHQREAVLQPR